MKDILDVLALVNMLIVPALWFVVRIDRRIGQLDILQATTADDIGKLEKTQDNLNNRLTRLEYKS